MKSNIEMTKPFEMEIDGQRYTLTFTRRTVVAAERMGFNVDEVDAQPMTMIPLLFHCAFLAKHPGITREQTDEIYFDKLHGLSKEEAQALVKLYAQVTRTLINEDTTERKNVKISL